jgi:hypothetical protein
MDGGGWSPVLDGGSLIQVAAT